MYNCSSCDCGTDSTLPISRKNSLVVSRSLSGSLSLWACIVSYTPITIFVSVVGLIPVMLPTMTSTMSLVV